jgi:hypothetical protein
MLQGRNSMFPLPIGMTYVGTSHLASYLNSSRRCNRRLQNRYQNRTPKSSPPLASVLLHMPQVALLRLFAISGSRCLRSRPAASINMSIHVQTPPYQLIGTRSGVVICILNNQLVFGHRFGSLVSPMSLMCVKDYREKAEIQVCYFGRW